MYKSMKEATTARLKQGLNEIKFKTLMELMKRIDNNAMTPSVKATIDEMIEECKP